MWFLSLLGMSQGFQLSNTLGSHMVLQRDVPANVWGFAAAHTQVKITFNGQQFTALTDDSGVWRLALPATKAGGPYTIKFNSTEGGAELDDILFGDVFMCGGQSNMQYTPKSGMNNATSEIAAAERYSKIRLFTVGQGTKSNIPLTSLKTIEQPWSVASSVSVGGPAGGYFAAVCWLFGRQIYDELEGQVPIGLISNNWGGTLVEQWSSTEALQACGKTGSGELWNAMIVPYTVGPMALTGLTWYQGESNVGAAAYYQCAFPEMITNWRKHLGQEQLWFGFVQIAGYNYGDGPAPGDLRQAQLAALKLPNVGYSTAIDVGMALNIHPTDKQTVAKRLANSALTQIYNKKRPYHCPTYLRAAASTVGTNITVRIDFEDGTVGTGLTTTVPPSALVVKAHQCKEAGLNETECGYPTIQVNDGRQTVHRATAKISDDGKSLILSVIAPVTGLAAISTSYGRASWPLTTFFNSDGLPVLGWYAPVHQSLAEVALDDSARIHKADGTMADYAH